MKILVKYNNSYYYWVDTVNTCAILVSSEGVAFPRSLDKIEVVDDSYNYEKQRQREIDELKSNTSMLKLLMELDEKIQGVVKK